MYEHLKGVNTEMDDEIIWGSFKEEHNCKLRKVFEAIQKGNLKLNKEKGQLGVTELTFCR